MPSKNHLARKMQVLQGFFLEALNLTSLAQKMKLFLQELKNLTLILKELARKNCKIIFLQDMIKMLQENYLAIFLASSCKISARFFNSCKKSFIFNARLARSSARSCKSCKRNSCKFLQDLHFSCKIVFTG